MKKDLLLTLLCIGALCLVFLGPCLDGDVFLSTEVVHRATPPWSGAPGTTAPTPHNPYLSDHSTILYPWLVHTRGELRAGRIPWWSGESYGGVPYFGNYSVSLLSPFTWAHVLLPLHTSFALVAALKWLVAGLGTLLFLRQLGLKGAAAVMPAVAYAFAGFQVVWINSALTQVSVLTPFCFYAAERCLQRPTGRRVAFLALAVFLQLMGGHPETSFYGLLGVGVYALCRILVQREARLPKLGALVTAAGLALALGAAQILAFVRYALASEGMRLRGAVPEWFRAEVDAFSPVGVGLCVVVAVVLWLGWKGAQKQRPLTLLLLVLLAGGAGFLLSLLGLSPVTLLLLQADLLGNPLDGGRYVGPNTYTDVTAGYCGAVVLVLAVVALVEQRKNPAVLSLGVALLVLLARVLRIPLLGALLDELPVFGATGASRALGTVSLLLPVLAGFGLQTLCRQPRAFLRPLVLVLGLGGGLALQISLLTDLPKPGAGEGPQWLNLPAVLDAGEDLRPESTGWTLEGLAPASARFLDLVINGRSADRLDLGAGEGEGMRPFQAYWQGLVRAPAGRYRIEARSVSEGTSGEPFASADLVLHRPVQQSWRIAILVLAPLVLVVALRCRRTGWTSLLVTGAVVAELALFGARYNDFTPSERMPAAVEPLPYLQEQLEEWGPFRVLGAKTALQPNLHYVFGIPVLRGYDALEPLAYTQVVRWLFSDQKEVIWFEQDFSTMDLGQELADVLNLRFVLSEEPPDPGFREVWRRGSLALHENVDVLPRAYLVQQGYSLAAHQGAVPASIRDRAVWDEGEDRVLTGKASLLGFDYSNGHMEATIDSESGTILVISENLDAGWSARLNDRKAALRRTHGCFMSLEIPAGRHELVLHYRPATLPWGIGLGIAAALVLCLLVLRNPGPRPAQLG